MPNAFHPIGPQFQPLGVGERYGSCVRRDAEFTGENTVRLFNNNSSGLTTNGLSSVQWIDLDFRTGQATLTRNQTHPDGLTAFAMGGSQDLPNGNTVVG